MITKLHKKENTAVNYLTEPITPYQLKIKAKEENYKSKQKAKWLKELSPSEVNHLKSALSQAFVTTQLQIECIDDIFEIQGVAKHFPLFKDFQNEQIKLESELRAISIHNEEDDANRLEIEKTVEKVLKTMPKLNIKQLELLSEFVGNLEFKK